MTASKDPSLVKTMFTRGNRISPRCVCLLAVHASKHDTELYSIFSVLNGKKQNSTVETSSASAGFVIH